MDLILGVVLLVFGILTLVRKELRLSDSRIARGTPAVVAGALLAAAFPIAYLVQIVLGLAAQSGTPLVGDATRGVLTYVVLFVVAAAAFAVAFRGTRSSS